MHQNYQSLAGEVRACEVKVYSVLYVDICMQVTVNCDETSCDKQSAHIANESMLNNVQHKMPN